MNYRRLDDVLAELANRLTTANNFSLTPKMLGQIIGEVAMDVRAQRERDEAAKEAAK